MDNRSSALKEGSGARIFGALGALLLFLLAMIVTAPTVRNVRIVSEKTGEELALKRPWLIPVERAEAFSNGKMKIMGELHLKGFWGQRTAGFELSNTRPSFEAQVGEETVKFKHYQILDPYYDQFFFKRYVLDGGLGKGRQVVPFVLNLENEIKHAPHVWWKINFWDPVFLLLWVGAVGSAWFFVFAVLRRFGAPGWASVAVMGAVLLSLSVLRYTKPNERTYDEGWGPGTHSQYVIAILEKGRIPKIDEGFVYYHSPFYYLIAAAAWSLAENVGVPNTYQVLQIMGVIFFGLYLTGGVLAIFQWVRNPWVSVVSVLTFCFWPAPFLHSVRTGNDGLMYALSAWAIFLGFRWWRLVNGNEGRIMSPWRKEWVWGIILAGAAFYAKSNGIVVVAWLGGMLGVVLLAWIYREKIKGYVESEAERGNVEKEGRWRDFVKCGGMLVGVMGVFGGLLLARNVETWHWKDPNFSLAHGFVPNTGALNPGMRAETSLNTFLVFDPFLFMNVLHNNPYNQDGKKYFWNYLFKTSLFGEYWIPGIRHDNMAWWLNFNFILILGMVIYGLVRYVEVDWWNKVPVYGLVILYFASMIYFRLKVPFACANEFRYILPALIPIGMIVGEFGLKGRTRFRVGVKVAVVVAFLLVSVAYWGILPERF
jgi:hypothetical protein